MNSCETRCCNGAGSLGRGRCNLVTACPDTGVHSKVRRFQSLFRPICKIYLYILSSNMWGVTVR
jgi:hypothetical protein